MAQYLYNFLSMSADQIRQDQQQDSRGKVTPGGPYPGQAFDYQAYFYDKLPENALPPDVVPVVNAASRLYHKKSMNDNNKQIRFHQCYFNPISCFKK